MVDNQKSRDLKKQLVQLQRELEQQKQKWRNLEKEAKLSTKQLIERQGDVDELVGKNNNY